ncbi:MAG: hypothetical protein J6T81_06115 [Bacteroidales bacterium]|nr:hypothetical protein [Bacteroidales bacterium]
MAKKTKEDIFVETINLLSDLYDFQWEMPKRDRIMLGNSIFQHTEKALADFILSYKLGSSEIIDKINAINDMMKEFSIVVVEIRMAIDKKMYQRESTVNKLREHIAVIDEGMIKWRAYVGALRQE